MFEIGSGSCSSENSECFAEKRLNLTRSFSRNGKSCRLRKRRMPSGCDIARADVENLLLNLDQRNDVRVGLAVADVRLVAQQPKPAARRVDQHGVKRLFEAGIKATVASLLYVSAADVQTAGAFYRAVLSGGDAVQSRFSEYYFEQDSRDMRSFRPARRRRPARACRSCRRARGRRALRFRP